MVGDVLKDSFYTYTAPTSGFPDSSVGKESACSAGDPGSIPGLGRASGEGKGYPLQCSGLENSMDCIVHGVAKSQTRLSDFHFIITPSRHYHNEKPSFPLVSSLFSSLYYQYVSLNSCQSRILCCVQTVPPRIGSSPASVQTEHQTESGLSGAPILLLSVGNLPWLGTAHLVGPKGRRQKSFPASVNHSRMPVPSSESLGVWGGAPCPES